MTFQINYEKDTMYSAEETALKKLLSMWCSGFFKIPDKPKTKPFFDEFVKRLRHARGDKFSSRLPLLAQLSNVFGLGIAKSNT